MSRHAAAPRVVVKVNPVLVRDDNGDLQIRHQAICLTTGCGYTGGLRPDKADAEDEAHDHREAHRAMHTRPAGAGVSRLTAPAEPTGPETGGEATRVQSATHTSSTTTTEGHN